MIKSSVFNNKIQLGITCLSERHSSQCIGDSNNQGTPYQPVHGTHSGEFLMNGVGMSGAPIWGRLIVENPHANG